MRQRRSAARETHLSPVRAAIWAPSTLPAPFPAPHLVADVEGLGRHPKDVVGHGEVRRAVAATNPLALVWRPIPRANHVARRDVGGPDERQAVYIVGP